MMEIRIAAPYSASRRKGGGASNDDGRYRRRPPPLAGVSGPTPGATSRRSWTPPPSCSSVRGSTLRCATSPPRRASAWAPSTGTSPPGPTWWSRSSGTSSTRSPPPTTHPARGNALRRPAVLGCPVRRFPGHQARPGQGAAVRPSRIREPARRVRRPPGARARPAAESVRRRRPDPRGHTGVRPDARHRQPVHRSRDLPRLPRSPHDRPAPRGPCADHADADGQRSQVAKTDS